MCPSRLPCLKVIKNGEPTLRRRIAALPEIDLASPLQFVINAAAGSSDARAKREVVEAALRAHGRQGDLLFCSPAQLTGVAHQAATKAIATRTAVVAVGGDGTLNTVAQAAHAAGCAIGVVPQGTFNYFARTHGIPAVPADAVRQLLHSVPTPVQVACINERVFLVNASLGLYPDLLEDREAYKARFGRSRWVAFVAACATLLRAQRRLRLHIEMGGKVRDMQTLTLFVGNNRLQLQQFGAEPDDTVAGTPGDGSMAALVLRPIGTLSMIGLMLHGAMGRLGEAAGVERFEFEHLVVRPTLPQGRSGVKVAFDGEVKMMRAPLDFRVLAKPLYLLKPQPDAADMGARSRAEEAAP
jgi:diacylglycerol kinase family enzyme